MSIVLDRVQQLDTTRCARDLMRIVKGALDAALKKNPKREVYGDFSGLLGMDEQHLKDLVQSNSPSLRRAEVNVFCMATSTGLDAIFGLPEELTQADVVKTEYDELFNSQGLTPQFLSVGGSGEDDLSNLDAMRSALYLRYLQMCLNKFPG